MKRSYRLAFQEQLPKPHKDVAFEANCFTVLSKEALGLFILRNNTYRNRFLEDGLPGIILRIRDKLRRLPQIEEDDESLVENILDIAIYSIMGGIIVHYAANRGKQCHHLFSETNGALRCILCNETWQNG